MKCFADKKFAIRIPIHIVEEVFDRGHAFMPMIDGSLKKITLDDIYISREDVIKMAKAEGLPLPEEFDK